MISPHGNSILYYHYRDYDTIKIIIITLSTLSTILMLTHDVDDLTKQLHELRLQQVDAIKNLAKINKVETIILKKI